MTAPMYPVYSPGQPQQAPPGVQFAQQPGFAPAPMYPVPGFAPQPAYPQGQQPMQYPQQAPQMPQFPQGTDLNQRLYGPQFPQELQGKTLGEAIRYYGIMREDFVNRTQQRQQPPLQGQPGFQPQQGQFQQPQQGRNYGPQQGFQSAQPQFPGQPQQPDPMRQMIQEAVQDALQPVVADSVQSRTEKAYAEIARRYPDFQHFAGEVFQSMQGAPPQMLVDPRAWEATYFHAKGRRTTFPYQQGGPGFQPTPIGQPQAAPQWPQQPQMPPQQPGFQGFPSQGPGGYPPQGQPTAFVEGPTPAAPMTGYPGQQGGADPRDEMFARRFGVPVEIYRMSKQNPEQAAMFALRARQPGPGQVQFQQGPPMPGQQQQVQFPPQQFPVPGYAAAPMNGAGGGYGF